MPASNKYFLNISSDETNAIFEKLIELSKKRRRISAIIPSVCHCILPPYQCNVARLIYLKSGCSADHEIPNLEPVVPCGVNWINSNDVISPHVLDLLALAQSVHTLADLLPCDSSSSLIVVCDGKLFNRESPNDHVQLYGSLLRLSLWHNAHITIIEDPATPSKMSRASKWSNALKCSVRTSEYLLSNFLLWNGSIELDSSFMAENPTIKNMQIVFLLTFLEDLIPEPENDFSEKPALYISQVMKVLQVCSISTVLPYFVHTSPLILSSTSTAKTKTMNPLIKYLLENPQSGVVVRLHYSYNATSVVSKDEISTTAWNNTILKGDVEKSFCQKTPSDSMFVNFLIYYNETSCDSVFISALRQPTEISPHFLNAIANSTKCPENQEESQKISKLLDEIPTFSASSWNRLQQEISDKVYEKIFVANDEKSADNLLLSPILQEVESSVLDHWLQNKLYQNEECGLQQEPNNTELQGRETDMEQLQDPSDWPERRFLLLYQLQNDKNDSLCGLTPPKSNQNVLEIKGNDLSNYFNSIGESKMPSKKLKKVANCGMKSSISQEQLKKLPWPDTLKSMHHDTYFNTGEAESNESDRMKLIERLVPYETKTWDSDNRCFYVSKPSAITPKSKKRKFEELANVRRSPRSLQSKMLERTKSERVLSAQYENQPRKHKSSTNTVVLVQSNSKKAKGKKSQSKSSAIRPPKLKKAPEQLDEKSKKKLREAVVVALESEGVKMDDPMFKSCGPRLFNICKAFVKDATSGKGVSALMKHVAQQHVKQVIAFEKVMKTAK